MGSVDFFHLVMMPEVISYDHTPSVHFNLDDAYVWLYNHTLKAEPIFREKRLLLNLNTGDAAIAELKIWSVPRSKDYPQGRKFSLFLVSGGRVVIGIDNHKPKGPHLHLGSQELPYLYRDEPSLVADFWDLARKTGFEP